jgi:hypothetical protein
VFSVISTADSGSNAAPAPGSLRWAIEQADALPPGSTAEIDFAISANGPTPEVITLASGGNPLPSLTVPTFLNGFSEGVYDGFPGYTGSPLIELNGSLAPGQNGLTLAAGSSDSMIQGISVVNFTESGGSGGGGILITPASTADVVQNNYIGVTTSGSTAGPNNIGVEVMSSGNTIGGNSGASTNVVSGNLTGGILVLQNYKSGSQAPITGNFVGCNHVGTSAAGSTALPNGTSPLDSVLDGFGIGVSGATGTSIYANLVSGNQSLGIVLTELGTDLTDTAPSGSTLLATVNNVIDGNLVGTDSSGRTAIGNNTDIEIAGAAGTTVGGTASGDGNVISGGMLDAGGYEGTAIEILGADATGVVVQGNLIGTDYTGNNALGDAGNGISIEDNAGGNTGGLHSFVIGLPSGVTVGGQSASGANVIAGSQGSGIAIAGQNGTYSSGDLIEGNSIGVFSNRTSSIASANHLQGISAAFTKQLSILGNLVENNSQDGIKIVNSASAVIGGPSIPDGNVIVANQAYGIEIDQSSTPSVDLIEDNLIGVTVSGATAPSPSTGNLGGGVVLQSDAVIAILGNTVENNTSVGIYSQGSTGVTIGGLTAAAANIIAADGLYGIEIYVDSRDVIEGNEIGSFAGDYVTASSGNTDLGIFGYGCASATIGGTAAGAGNFIAGNHQYGVGFESMRGVSLAGNTIDYNSSGGVYSSSARFSTESYTGNTIEHNRGHGIYVIGSYVDISLQGNAVELNTGIGISMHQTSPSQSNLPIQLSVKNDQVSSNGGGGIYVSTGKITLLLQGSTVFANSGSGVVLDESNATIGGTTTGAANVIANNTGAGIAIMKHNSPPENTGDLISGNSITGNLGLGIDLGDTGLILPNGSGPGGPDASQNYPVLTGATISGTSATVTGSLTGSQNQVYTVQFFANTTAAQSGYGGGQTYLGSTTVTPNASNIANFTIALGMVNFGSIISATAIDPNNNTSEFSKDVQAVALTTTTLSSSANPAVYSQSVTFTATVTALAPGAMTATGTVNFFDGGTKLNAAPVAVSSVGGAYQATFSTSALAIYSAGGHSITATYSGDSNTFGSQSGVLVQFVGQDQTTTSLVTSSNPSVFGQSVTITATVSVTSPGSATPAGTINLFDGAARLNATPLALVLVNQHYQATLSTAALAVSATSGHAITAVYSGDADTLGSQSAPLAQLVDQDQTATTVVTSLSPTVFGQSVTFTATVRVTAPGTAIPSGTINFLDGASVLNATPAPLSLVGGLYQSTFSTSALAVNSTSGHAITAVYSGDADTLVSQSTPVAQLVDQDQTAISVVTSQSPAVFGQQVTFTATVSVVAPGAGTPTGTVNFLDGTSLLNAAPAPLSLVGGHYQATFSTSALAVNPTSGHTITAMYSGDANTAGSQSSAIAQLVNQDQTTTSVSSSANPSVFGQPVTFTAIVRVIAPGSGTPTGTVNFVDGATILNATPALLSLVSGQYQAIFSTTALVVNAGTGHSIAAVYSGDTATAASQGLPVAQIVNRDQTTTSVASSANPSVLGQLVTFTATVSVVAPGAGIPTGTISFLNGTAVLNATPAPLSLVGARYQATFSTSALALSASGGYSITAVYSGDTDTAGGPSTAVTQLVDQDQTATSLSTSLNPVVFGQSVSFTATVSVTAPGVAPLAGTVNFFDGATLLNGTPAVLSLVSGHYQATFATSTLAVASVAGHAITAVYSGDTNTQSSQSSPLTEVVNQDQTTTAIATSLSPTVFGQSVTFTATVSVLAPGAATPTGTINFLDGTSLLNATPATLSLVGGRYQATFSTSTLAVNSTTGHTITAIYSGDTDTTGSQSTPIAQFVGQDQSTITVATSLSPSVFGQTVTFTATVTVASPGAGTPTGSVGFVDGTTLLNATPAALSLVSGRYQASFSTSVLAVNSAGGHSIIGVYSGDTDTAGSQSAPIAQLVDQDQTTTSLTTSVSPTVFGQSITFAATVNVAAPGAATPTGTINFLDGGSLLNPIPSALSLVGGHYQATYSTATLAVSATGGHSIIAVYSGDTNTIASQSPVTTQIVDQDQTATTVTSSANPSVVGQSVTLTAMVSVMTPGSGTPTGSINFLDGGSLLNQNPAALNLVGGHYQATFVTSALASSATSGHSITAVYSGDTNALGSQSTPIAQLVDPDQTATTVATSLSPSVFGQSVTLTATVSVPAPGTAVPTGTINFFDGGVLLNNTPATLSVVGGQYAATFSTPTLAVNSSSGHVISAAYSGDTNTLSSQSASLTQLVYAFQTTTTIASSVSTSVFGQSVTFTATVSVTAPGSGTPTGTINFFDGGAILNSTPVALSLVNGKYQATLSTSALAVSATTGHSIMAVYSGDANTGSSQSPPIVQLVDQDQTTTTVTTSLSPTVFGQSVNLTAIVSVTAPGSGPPAGTINFLDGGAILNSTPIALSLVNGKYQATLSTSALAVSATTGHSITAVYSGDLNNQLSQSPALAQLVDRAASKTNLQASANPAVQGDDVRYTAIVSSLSSGTGTVVGSVEFRDGTNVLATVSLDAGVATFADSSMSPGAHALTAIYIGSPDFASSESTVVNESIQAITTTVLSSPTLVTSPGQPLTLTATVSAPSGTASPSGSVTFLDGSQSLGTVQLDGNSAVSLAIDDLPVGVQSISASYSGDSLHTSSTSAVQSITIVSPVPPTGPTVSSVKRYGKNNQRPSYVLISFSAPLDPTTAQLVSNYSIVGPIKKRKTPTHGPAIRSAVYSAATNTVTLVISKTWSASSRWRFRINGSAPGGVAGSNGAPLNGANTPPRGGTLPGTNYVATLSHKNLAGPAKSLPTIQLVTASHPAASPRVKLTARGRKMLLFGSDHPAASHHFLALARGGRRGSPGPSRLTYPWRAGFFYG